MDSTATVKTGALERFSKVRSLLRSFVTLLAFVRLPSLFASLPPLTTCALPGSCRRRTRRGPWKVIGGPTRAGEDPDSGVLSLLVESIAVRSAVRLHRPLRIGTASPRRFTHIKRIKASMGSITTGRCSGICFSLRMAACRNDSAQQAQCTQFLLRIIGVTSGHYRHIPTDWLCSSDMVTASGIMQTGRSPYARVDHVLRYIYKSEGVLGFFRHASLSYAHRMLIS